MHAYNVFHKSWAPHAVMMILAMKQSREEHEHIVTCVIHKA